MDRRIPIIIDTREQEPYAFDSQYFSTTRRAIDKTGVFSRDKLVVGIDLRVNGLRAIGDDVSRGVVQPQHVGCHVTGKLGISTCSCLRS